ncbi:MAG: hypothetical protein JXA25_10485 [Anaerolineales bacterium]|nr:hypothetical protein [Anaerolineales bacterium]
MTSNNVYDYSDGFGLFNFRRVIKAGLIGAALILFSVLSPRLFLQQGRGHLFLDVRPSGADESIPAGMAGGLLLKAPQNHYQQTDEYMIDLDGFFEERPVYLITFPEIEGEALCLTQNAKQCEQLLSFRTGEQGLASLYVPKDSVLFGILQEGAVGNFTDRDIQRSAFNRELRALDSTGRMLVEHAGVAWSESSSLGEAQAAAVLNRALDWRELSALLAEEAIDQSVLSVLQASPPAESLSERALRSLNKQLLRIVFAKALREVSEGQGWYYTAVN